MKKVRKEHWEGKKQWRKNEMDTERKSKEGRREGIGFQ